MSRYHKPIRAEVDINPYELPYEILDDALASEQAKYDDTVKAIGEQQQSLLDTPYREGIEGEYESKNEAYEDYMSQIEKYSNDLDGELNKMNALELNRIAADTMKKHRPKLDAIQKNYNLYEEWRKKYDKLSQEGKLVVFDDKISNTPTVDADGNINVFRTDGIEEQLDWYKGMTEIFKSVVVDKEVTDFLPGLKGLDGNGIDRGSDKVYDIFRHYRHTIESNEHKINAIKKHVDHFIEHNPAINQKYRIHVRDNLKRLKELYPESNHYDLNNQAKKQAREDMVDLFMDVATGQTKNNESLHKKANYRVNPEYQAKLDLEKDAAKKAAEKAEQEDKHIKYKGLTGTVTRTHSGNNTLDSYQEVSKVIKDIESKKSWDSYYWGGGASHLTANTFGDVEAKILAVGVTQSDFGKGVGENHQFFNRQDRTENRGALQQLEYGTNKRNDAENRAIHTVEGKDMMEKYLQYLRSKNDPNYDNYKKYASAGNSFVIPTFELKADANGDMRFQVSDFFYETVDGNKYAREIYADKVKEVEAFAKEEETMKLLNAAEARYSQLDTKSKAVRNFADMIAKKHGFRGYNDMKQFYEESSKYSNLKSITVQRTNDIITSLLNPRGYGQYAGSAFTNDGMQKALNLFSSKEYHPYAEAMYDLIKQTSTLSENSLNQLGFTSGNKNISFFQDYLIGKGLDPNFNISYGGQTVTVAHALAETIKNKNHIQNVPVSLLTSSIKQADDERFKKLAKIDPRFLEIEKDFKQTMSAYQYKAPIFVPPANGDWAKFGQQVGSLVTHMISGPNNKFRRVVFDGNGDRSVVEGPFSLTQITDILRSDESLPKDIAQGIADKGEQYIKQYIVDEAKENRVLPSFDHQQGYTLDVDLFGKYRFETSIDNLTAVKHLMVLMDRPISSVDLNDQAIQSLEQNFGLSGSIGAGTSKESKFYVNKVQVVAGDTQYEPGSIFLDDGTGKKKHFHNIPEAVDWWIERNAIEGRAAKKAIEEGNKTNEQLSLEGNPRTPQEMQDIGFKAMSDIREANEKATNNGKDIFGYDNDKWEYSNIGRDAGSKNLKAIPATEDMPGSITYIAKDGVRRVKNVQYSASSIKAKGNGNIVVSALMKPKLDALNSLLDQMNLTTIVTSSHRSVERQSLTAGFKKGMYSPHMQGLAVDLRLKEQDRDSVAIYEFFSSDEGKQWLEENGLRIYVHGEGANRHMDLAYNEPYDSGVFSKRNVVGFSFKDKALEDNKNQS